MTAPTSDDAMTDKNNDRLSDHEILVKILDSNERLENDVADALRGGDRAAAWPGYTFTLVDSGASAVLTPIEGAS